MLVTSVHRGDENLDVLGGVLVFIFDDVQRIRSSVNLRQPPPGARVVVRSEVEVRRSLVHDVPGVGTARGRDESDGGVAVGGDAVGFRRRRPRRRSVLGVPTKREMHRAPPHRLGERPRVAAGTGDDGVGVVARATAAFERVRVVLFDDGRDDVLVLRLRREGQILIFSRVVHPALSDRRAARVVVVHRNVDISRVRGGFQHDAPLARRLEVPVHLNLPRHYRLILKKNLDLPM